MPVCREPGQPLYETRVNPSMGLFVGIPADEGFSEGLAGLAVNIEVTIRRSDSLLTTPVIPAKAGIHRGLYGIWDGK